MTHSFELERFPVPSDAFALYFGVQAIDSKAPLVHATGSYQNEIHLKSKLLAGRAGDCWAEASESFEAQVDTVNLLIRRCRETHPLAKKRTDENGFKTEKSPLLSISRFVQEDLVVLKQDAANGFPIIAGCVCFPSGWSITDKLGQSQRCVHETVPEFGKQLLAPSLKLLQRLKPGRSVSRNNWGVRALARLPQFSSDAEEIHAASQAVSFKSAADCMFRVEYQTLSRLPTTGDILFTIHTHQRTLAELSQSEKDRLARVIETCPERSLRYKGIWSMREPVVEYLKQT